MSAPLVDIQDSSERHSYIAGNARWFLRPALLLLGVLMIFFIVPVSNASNPHITLNGTFDGDNTVTSFEQKGQGPIVITLDAKAIFTSGGVEGTVTGKATAIFLAKGNFSLHITGVFDGSIDGREGTAQFNAVVNGVDPSLMFCCYRGPIEFFGGTGDLEGLSATGVFTNNPIDGREYSLDVMFR